MAIITLGDLKTIWEQIRDRAYDSADDMTKVKSVQKKFRDSFPGAALDTTKWESTIGTGGSITISGGTVTLASGTTANAETYLLSKETFTIPFRISFQLTMSQRIANQTFLVEAISVNKTTGIPDGLHSAALLFDGTTVTQAKYRVQNSGVTPLDSAASTVVTTAGTGVYEIEPFADECWFHSTTLDSTGGRANSYRRHQQIPDPNAVYKIRVRWLNGASVPASSTNAVLQYVTCQDYAELTAEITAGRGNSVAGQGLSVNVTTMPTTTVTGSGTFTVGGVAAHDAVISGNPERLAGRAVTANYTAVQTGDVADLITTLVGALIQRPYSIPELEFQVTAPKAGLLNTTTPLQIKDSAGAGLKNYITSAQLYSEALTNATEIEIREPDLTCASQTISANTLTTSATHNLVVGDAVVFTASTVTGITVGTTYYVLTVPAGTTLTLSATRGGSALTISGTGVTATFHKYLWGTKIPTAGLPLTELSFNNPLRGSTATAMQIQTLTASGAGAVFFNAQGYVAP